MGRGGSGKHPVEVGAEPVGRVVGLDWPAKPARMETPGNPIADFDPCYPVADCSASPAPLDSGITPSLVGPRPPPLRTIRSR